MFVFGINGIFACMFKHGGVKHISFFDIHDDKTTEAIIHEIEDYLTAGHGVPVKIIIDGVGQSFVAKSVQKSLKARELNQFLASKLATDLKHSTNSIKTSRIIKADASEKTNEYILSSISFDQSYTQILNAIVSSYNPIIGFYSSAAEMHDIATPTEIDEKGKPYKQQIMAGDGVNQPVKSKKSAQKAGQGDDAIFTYDASSRSGTADGKNANKPWTITVAMLETSGLRITISVGNSIILTRVKKINTHSFNETSGTIKAEIENVIGYVEKSSMLPRSKLFMSIFGSRDFVSIIEAIAPDVGNINMFLMQDYISASKNKNLAKEYNYPAILTLAYKVHKQPFIEYRDETLTINNSNKLIFHILIIVSIVCFFCLNAFAVLKFLHTLQKQKTYKALLTGELAEEKKFKETKNKAGGGNIEKNLSLAKLFSFYLQYEPFDETFKNIFTILQSFSTVNVNSIEYLADGDKVTYKVNMYFAESTEQDVIIEKIKNNSLGYTVAIENINQETHEVVILFTKNIVVL